VYPNAIASAALEAVEFLPNFPVATVSYGYTRDEREPGASQLVPFRWKGKLRVYGSIAKTEALLFKLDPLKVWNWLAAGGLVKGEATTSRDARLSLLDVARTYPATEEHPDDVSREVMTLVHSYAHRTIRRLAASAGIERDSLAEYLIPGHLAYIVYAASRGDFVLGGLQAVFETRLHEVLDDIVNGESRCPLDPGCRSGGGACMACLHLGEMSCRRFNRDLDRRVLFGAGGYLR
jgi:hypothetical protein